MLDWAICKRDGPPLWALEQLKADTVSDSTNLMAYANVKCERAKINWARCPSCRPTNAVQALKGDALTQ